MSQITFPNNPENGDLFPAPNGTTYIYRSSSNQWEIKYGRGSQGPAGPSGPTGATGADGYIGVDGATGSTGPIGPAFNISGLPDLPA